MKYRLLFCVMITLLTVCSALFANHIEKSKNTNDSVAVMSYIDSKEENAGITFTDLAEKVNAVINGVKD